MPADTGIKVPVFEDLVIPWEKVQPQDQLLREGELVLVTRVTCIYDEPWGKDDTYTRVDVSYRTDDGHDFTSDHRGDKLCAVKREVKQPFTYSSFRSMLGEGTHTAFRKATDDPLAMPIHRLIEQLGPGEWSEVVTFVADPIWDLLTAGRIDEGSRKRWREARRRHTTT